MTHTPSNVIRRADEFDLFSPSAKAGVLYIRSLSDEEILEAARSETSEAHARITAHLGASTNPHWIVAACAEESYCRGLIDERELDHLMR